MTILRAAGLSLVGVLLTGSLAACGTSAAPDFLVLRYDKGTDGGLSFKECIQPSRKTGTTWNDQNFSLPTSLRTWNITPEGQGGDSFIPVQTGTQRVPVLGSATKETQPGADVKIYTRTQFYLNTDCGEAKDGKSSKDDGKDSAAVRFWENTGRRYNVSTSTDDGGKFEEANWLKMLQNTLVTAQQAAIRGASRNYNADNLDSDVDGVWKRLEAEMAGAFTRELQASVGGGDYFCGPQYRRDAATGRPVTVTWTEPDPTDPTGVKTVEKTGPCPPVRIAITDVILADQRIIDARAEVVAAQLRARAADIGDDSKVRSANKLKQTGAQGAAIQQQQNELAKEQERTKQVQACAAAGARCVVVTGNGGVNVGTGQ